MGNRIMSLVRLSKSPRVRTEAALLYDVAGDAGAMLGYLLVWGAHSKRADGAVYMSWRDWWDTLRIARHRLPRLNKLLMTVGVRIARKKAGGAPTNHYYVNQVMVARKLARVLGVSAGDVCNAMGWVEAMQCLKTRQTITTDSALESSLHVVVRKEILQEGTDSVEQDGRDAEPIPGEVLALGVTEKVARELVAQYGAARLVQVAGAARDKKRPAAWLVAACRGGWTVQPGRVADPAWQETPVNIPASVFAKRAAPVARGIDCPEWEAAMGQLELQFDRGNFERYLRGLACVGVEDGVYVVEARNVLARDMLQHRLYRDVRRVLRDVVGREVEIRFEVRQEAA